MPYKLGDRTLQLDVAWEHNDVQYPANWLRLSTEEDRASLGITWEAESIRAWDQRFYWGYDAERGTTMNAEWKTWRQTIRTECGTKIEAIEATASIGDLAPHVDIARVQALAEYVTGSDYYAWTSDPDTAEIES